LIQTKLTHCFALIQHTAKQPQSEPRHHYHTGSSFNDQQQAFEKKKKQMFGYTNYQKNMVSQLLYQFQASFSSQENMFSMTPNIFSISTMTTTSIFCPILPTHCYQPNMSSERFHNPSHDSPPPPPPSTKHEP